MRIGIVGTGNLGRAIDLLFDRIGHEVLFGARRTDEGKYATGLANGPARCGSNDDAAIFGDIIFWTVRETDPAKVLKNPGTLDGKILVDVNNRAFDGGPIYSLSSVLDVA